MTKCVWQMVLATTFLMSGCAAAAPSPVAVQSGAPVAADVERHQAAKDSTDSDPWATRVVLDPSIQAACGVDQHEAYFGFDEARLAKSHDALAKVAACFSDGALRDHSMRLTGHADARGTPDYNFALGHARADAVARWMHAMGVPPDRTKTTTRGELDAHGWEQSSWALDRRVDIALLQ